MHRILGLAIILLFTTNLVFAGKQENVLFTLPNENPYLQIIIRAEEESSGPADFDVTNGLVAVLDSQRGNIVYFDKKGNFVKKVTLPRPGYYERLIRLRDGTLLAFADTALNQTRMVHIDEDSVVEEQLLDMQLGNIRTHLLVDDFGLFIENQGALDYQSFLSLKNQSSEILAKKAHAMMQQTHRLSVNQNCWTCRPVQTKGATVGNLVYRIHFNKPRGDNPSVFIGDKEIKLDQLHRHGGTHLVQIDSDGAAWVSEAIFLDKDTIVTYLWKYAASGKLVSAYLEPEMYVDDYVQNNLVIGDDEKVYYMGAQKNGLVFQEVKPLSKNQLDEALSELKKGPPIRTKKMTTPVAQGAITKSSY